MNSYHHQVSGFLRVVAFFPATQTLDELFPSLLHLKLYFLMDDLCGTLEESEPDGEWGDDHCDEDEGGDDVEEGEFLGDGDDQSHVEDEELVEAQRNGGHLIDHYNYY